LCKREISSVLPSNPLVQVGGEKQLQLFLRLTALPVCLISYGYICMLGSEGITDATKYAILNANYKARLEEHYPILYTGETGRAAHEDFRLKFQRKGIEVVDIAKRLMDYGFHANGFLSSCRNFND
jgi:glycine dehydrogenase